MTNINTIAKVFSVFAFLIMVSVNALANLLPLNGVTTGELSNMYPTLITPAAYTFLIWIIIYLLLFSFTIYQLEFAAGKRKLSSNLADFIRGFYIVSCLCNAVWIFAWHYKYIALSLVLMVTLFICLGFMYKLLYEEELSLGEKIFIRLPFSIYFGWITVATVTNVAALLVSIRWSGFGITRSVWAIITAIGIFVYASYITLKNSSLAYTATVIWAFLGLVVKHTAQNELNGKYPNVIIALIACIGVLVLEMGYCIVIKKRLGNK